MNEDFFKAKEIKKIRKLAGGDTYTIIYLKLMLLSLRENGHLFYDGIEDSFAEELSLELDEEAENVRITLGLLQRFGMLEEVTSDEAFLPQMQECVGSETSKASLMRRKRASEKALDGNNVTAVLPTVTFCYTEKEKEKEIEIDTDIERERKHESYDESCHESSTSVRGSKNDQAEALFAEFWAAYPKHINKAGCFKAFRNIKGMNAELLGQMLKAIKAQKQSKQWQKDGGEYIPHPLTWLHQRRWEDEAEEQRESSFDADDFFEAAVRRTQEEFEKS